MNVTELSEFENKCTGCLACTQICAVEALHSEKNNEGFYYPVLDSEKCIDCGKCLSGCSLYKTPPKRKPFSIFSAYSNNDEFRKSGSSGGIVVALSNFILRKDGIVFGAVFDKKEKEIYHSSTKKFSLQELSRSKYVQSYTGGTFFEVENDLKSGNTVLFCGTPCQIEGLQNYLGKEYNNLFTIDFFCHGVPSNGVFKNMLLELEKNENSAVDYVSFRDKKEGWHKLALEIGLENSKTFRFAANENPYYFYFLHNYSLRKSCYICDRYIKHTADITVADYWLINKEEDDDKGVSLVLVNSQKGADLIDEIKKEINLCELKENLDYSVYEHNYPLKNREVFFGSYVDKGLNYTFTKLFEKEKEKKQFFMKVKRKLIKLFGR